MSLLPSAKYIVTNVAQQRAIGLPPTLPTKQPIISSSPGALPQIWDVRGNKNGYYTLKISNFGTQADDKLVWGLLESPGQEWVIKQRAEGKNEYTIICVGLEPMGWTLGKSDDTQVSLKMVIESRSFPPHISGEQLWQFERPGPLELLRLNEEWARQIRENDPGYFPSLASQPQTPKVLWIGCSDSRVPETTICNCTPGDIFTHRNIANLVHLTDDSVQSVIAFAVGALKVEHIIVVGHSECGGVEAAWEASKDLNDDYATSTPLNRWLAPLAKLSKQLGLDKKPKEEALPELTRRSVEQQVKNVIGSEPVKQAWQDPNWKLHVHGWVYELDKGELRSQFIHKHL